MASKFTIATVFTAIDQVTGVTKGIGKSVGELEKKTFKLSKVLRAIGGAAVSAAVVKIGKSFFDAGSEVEKYKTTLTVMLGSQELAVKRFDEMSKFAQITPFELTEVVQLGNQLQALGKYSVENMTILGDLASAAGKPIEQVTRAFAKLASGQKGVAVDMFRDLLITTDDWVKATGTGVSKTGELMATTEQMLAALPKILNAKGFYGMMDMQSKTFSGKMSNMKDSIFQLQEAFGSAMIGPAGEAIEKVGQFINDLTNKVRANAPKIGEIFSSALEKIIAVLDGGMKILPTVIDIIGFLFSSVEPLAPVIIGIVAALTLYNIIMAAMAIKTAIVAAATTEAAIAQGIFNAAISANPIAAICIAIGILIAIIVLMVKNWEAVSAVLTKVGQTFMKSLLLPINLVMSGIVALLDVASNIPGIGGAFKAAADGARGFQNQMNKTLTGTEGALDFSGVWNPPAVSGDLSAMGSGVASNILAAGGRRAAPVSSNTTINKNTNSTVDINLRGAPQGTTTRQTGQAPGIKLNLGFAGAR